MIRDPQVANSQPIDAWANFTNASSASLPSPGSATISWSTSTSTYTFNKNLSINGSNTTRIVVPFPGIYEVNMAVNRSGSGNFNASVAFYVNGSYSSYGSGSFTSKAEIDVRSIFYCRILNPCEISFALSMPPGNSTQTINSVNLLLRKISDNVY